MTVVIPTSAIPNQEFSVVLDGQNCVIALRQLAECLYADLTVDDVPVFRGRVCGLYVPLNLYRSQYFRGSLWFADTKGSGNPTYEGLNDRWLLCYTAEGEDE